MINRRNYVSFILNNTENILYFYVLKVHTTQWLLRDLHIIHKYVVSFCIEGRKCNLYCYQPNPDKPEPKRLYAELLPKLKNPIRQNDNIYLIFANQQK